MERIATKRWAATALIAAMSLTARGQPSESLSQWPEHEFSFARLIYYDIGGRSFGGSAWSVDYPEAEYFFHKGVSRL